jgi:hypothetical protein
MRDQLRTQIVTNISAYTNFSVSTELPWEQNDSPLYLQNMKVVYVGAENVQTSELVEVANAVDVFQTETLVSVYVAVDAKNEPVNTQSVLSGIRSAMTLTSVNGIISRNVDMNSVIDEDVTTYTFDFTFITL